MSSLSVTPDRGIWGSSAKVVGSGFTPYTRIRVSLCVCSYTTYGNYVDYPSGPCLAVYPYLPQAFKDVNVDVMSDGSFVIDPYVIENPFGYPPNSFYGRILVSVVDGGWGPCAFFTVTAPSSATVTVRGKCTGGYPLPSMLLEIYDGGVKIKSKTISVVSIGSVYEDSVVVTGAGIHGVLGRMVLTSPLGSYELLTETKEFTLG